MNKTVSQESEMFPHIQAWKSSGLSQKSYCEQNNIASHIFHYWLSKYRIREQGVDTEKGFVAVKVVSAKKPAASLEVIGCNGNRLIFFEQPDVSLLKSLLS
ncbi:hypothetical protein BDE36_0230 [Arcticibacter tournemirensis]|uniref:IS66 family insertion sequence element accessory protein TnpA n=1 Tax=Arcticibacter tournemirensis TaxID=699437 RepID=UPI001151B01C|nr:hypothetical protein [Arcticibacter tournemirensis]TQM48545.1 hypothetical protein BDE36_0230 [Arcticibacter tournemirensis]